MVMLDFLPSPRHGTSVAGKCGSAIVGCCWIQELLFFLREEISTCFSVSNILRLFGYKDYGVKYGKIYADRFGTFGRDKGRSC
jgi:hypothetical protein